MFDSRRASSAALLLLPAGLMIYFAFNAGGFYSAAPAYVAIVLAVVLFVRVTGAASPLEGVGPGVAIATGLLGAYAVWTLVSEQWSHAPGLALVEFDRALLYLLAIVLFGAVARTRFRLVWILRIVAAAIVVVCACALITRLLPHVWPTNPNLANNRLSYPVTYWNVLGLLAALGIVLCIHFTSEEREPILSRILAAAAVPVLATTLYFTFSRGSIGVCIAGLVAYVLLGRPRALLSGALATLPLSAMAVKAAYDANLLATLNATTPAAVAQGRHVAIIVLFALLSAAAVRIVLALLLDRRLAALRLPPRHRRRIVSGLWAVLAAAFVIAVVALSGTISHQYHRFLNPKGVSHTSDLRSRLTDPGNNGRLEMWRIAWREFKQAPIVGDGAGTFKNIFATQHSTNAFVVNAHSLYLQTLDELGIVGFVLLAAVILMILVRAATRIRGPDRALHAAVFAVLLAYAVETGIDWDWEMPVVTILFFALGGITLARSPDRATTVIEESAGRSSRGSLAPPLRIVLGVGCALVAVAPAYVWLSQRKLNQATAAFAAGDCRAATDNALSAISILGVRAEPYELVAYCDVHRDLPKMAIQSIHQAISLDPQNWNYWYGLALMRAAAGLNPLAAAHRALRLNPKEPLAQQAWSAFSTDTRAQWQSDGATAADAFTTL